MSLDVVLNERSVVGGLVCPSEFTEAILLSIDVVAVIASTVRPGLQTSSMLFIFLPLTLVFSPV
jgi:hypothetical protein